MELLIERIKKKVTVYDKWKPFFENHPKTNSWLGQLNQLVNNQKTGTGEKINNAFYLNNENPFDNIMFPMIKRIFSSTIAQGNPEPENNRYRFLIIEKRFYKSKSEKAKEQKYHEGLVTVKPMSLPTGLLFYTDYKYSASKELLIEKNKKGSLRRYIERIETFETI